ncbi:MAG: hypothetical protein IPJ81_01960 [Chitinophagaceae bacterium]|nr:hypothetical protein [Chitinophagaceae bacterium]
MRSNKINIKIVSCLLIAYCMLPFVSFSQSAQTTINKNSILIGEQIQYTIKAFYNPGTHTINWFTIPDTIPHFEIIQISPLDSLIEKNKTTLTQTITYTSFDSGKWVIPSLNIKAKLLKEDTAIDLITDSFDINVLYAQADSTNQLRDIKPIIEVTVTSYFWYYVIGAILLLAFLAWIIRRYYKNKNKFVNTAAAALSPYDEAMQDLEKLQLLNLLNHQEMKQFHVQLGIIFKRYYSRISGKNMLNNTTGDMLMQLSMKDMSKEDIAKSATALRCGDAVKFAKFIPSAEESENCKHVVAEVIKNSNQYFIKQ